MGSAFAICRQTREAIYHVAAKPAIPRPTPVSLLQSGSISSYNCSSTVCRLLISSAKPPCANVNDGSNMHRHTIICLLFFILHIFIFTKDLDPLYRQLLQSI